MGLPHNLPEEVQNLLRYAMLHDFTHSQNHPSKIYVEPAFTNVDNLRKHHEKVNDPLIQKFQKYNRLAAMITRRIRSPRKNRYNWRAKGK